MRHHFPSARHQAPDPCLDLGQCTLQASNQGGVGHTREQYRPRAHTSRPLHLQGGPRTRLVTGPADTGPPVINSLVAGRAQIKGALRLFHEPGIGLFIQRMRRHRRGSSTQGLVHALQDEIFGSQLSQHRIASTRLTAQGGAFDDLGHVQGQSRAVAQHLWQSRKNRGVAGTPGHQHVGQRSQCALEGATATVSYTMAACAQLRFIRQGQVQARCRRLERPQPPLAYRLLQSGDRHITGYRRHAYRPAPVSSHLTEQLQGRLQMRAGTRSPRTANNQGHIQPPGCTQYQLKVTADHGRLRRHLTRTQIERPRVDGSHVTTYEMRSPLHAAIKSRLGNTKTQLPGCGQDPKALHAGAMGLQQASHRAHN